MFRTKMQATSNANSSLLCVGLDPYEVPVELVADFNRAIIDATQDLVCAYKPNFAIYDDMGGEGLNALEETLNHIPDGTPVIADGKRGDIENCGQAYAHTIFGTHDFDAVTLYGYMGQDAVEPFVSQAWKDRYIFILCRTSNKRSGDLQLLKTEGLDGIDRPYYQELARQAVEWSPYGNIGFVMGATFPEELKTLREQHPSAIFLLPGIGIQGGDLAKAVSAAATSDGEGYVVSVSRSVIFAGLSEPSALTKRTIDPAAEAARESALSFRDAINEAMMAGATP